MGLIETASGNSVWRGMEYYEKKKVISWESTGATTYSGIVSGSNGEKYTVCIDKKHPRKSTCNCAFAEGRRVVCKHMIALYFTAEPEAAENFLKQVAEWEAEEEAEQQKHYDDLRKYVKSLSKVELQEHLYNALVMIEEMQDRRSWW